MALRKQFFSPRTQEDFDQLYQLAAPLWQTTKPTEKIAAQLNISISALYRLAKRYKLPKRAHLQKRVNYRKDVSDPSPEEIARRAKAIRRAWTPEERANRRVKKSLRVTIQNFGYNETRRHFYALNHPQLPET